MAFRLEGSYAPLQMEQESKTVSVIILDKSLRPVRPTNGAHPIDVEPGANGTNGMGDD
jgi:hypothetical protein